MPLDAAPAPAAATLSTVTTTTNTTTTQASAGLDVHDGLNATQIEEARAALETWFWGWDFNVDVYPADGTMTASVWLTRPAWGDALMVNIYREQDRVAATVSLNRSLGGVADLGDYATTTEAMAAALAWIDVWRGVTAPAGSTTENETTTGR